MELLDRLEYATQHMNEGEKLIGEGKIEDAIEEFKTAVEFIPTSATLNRLACAHYANKNYVDAFKRNLEAWSLQPTSGKILNDLGYCTSVLGKYEKAIGFFEQALLDENFQDRDLTILELANCHYQLDDWGKALHYYERWSSLHPDDDDVKIIIHSIRTQIN